MNKFLCIYKYFFFSKSRHIFIFYFYKYILIYFYLIASLYDLRRKKIVYINVLNEKCFKNNN